MWRAMGVVLVLLALSVFAGCSDDKGQESEEGVLLPGDPDDLAVEATYDLSILPEFDPAYVSVELHDGREVSFLRTELVVAFERDATVGEVNEVLQGIDAKIVDMVPRRLDLILRIDDPGNMEAVRALVEEVERRESVIEATESVLLHVPGEDIAQSEGPLLPEGFEDDDGNPERLDRIDHQLAVRAHAAWNAKDAIVPLEERPWLMVTDLFGDGAPDEMFNVEVERAKDFAKEDDKNLGGPNRHGYHVLGIATGAFYPVDPTDDQERDDVTGIFPEKLRLRAVDMERKLTAGRYVNRSGARISAILDEDPEARVVMTSSIHERWSGTAWRARGWTRTVRDDPTQVGSGMEDQFIHFTSTGNAIRQDDGSYERWDAEDNGPFAYAALGHMETVFGTEYPNLTNIHVVENRRNTSHEPPLPACASVSSIMGGTLSAIGADVYSMGDCAEWDGNSCEEFTGQSGASEASGTSMATPQAAGLAAFMWSVNPDLSVSEIHEIIKDTAYWSLDMENLGSDCNPEHGEPVIDALAAVLAAGGDDVRVAMLDVTRSGSFDQFDMAIFAEEFETSEGDVLYSRYDLTGDGVIGSALHRSVSFDLDGSRTLETVEQSIVAPAGPAVTLQYDEESVSDWDVLCYYAYSDLYEGDSELRDELIGGRCSGAYIEVTVADTSGSPLEGVPLKMERDGNFAIHSVEDLGEGQYRMWVRESDGNYTIEVPDGYTISGDTEIGALERYEIVEDVEVEIVWAPDATLEITSPAEGRIYREMSEVTVAAALTTPSEVATVTLELNGDEVDSLVLEGHGEHSPRLQIDALCPRGTAELRVILEDGFGNEVVETVGIEVEEAVLGVQILGAGMVEIAYEDSPPGGADPHWYVPQQTLEGVVRKPSCDYPDDSHLDAEELVWWDADSWDWSQLQSGSTMEVDDAFFREQGELVARTVGLTYDYQGEEAQTQREITPCYGEIHIHHDLTTEQGVMTFGTALEAGTMSYPDGPVPEEAYPPCVTHRTTHTGLEERFGDMLAELDLMKTQLEAEALLGDLFADLLAELGPPEPFPKGHWQLTEEVMMSWDWDIYYYVNQRLGDALIETTLSRFEQDLNTLLAEANQDLSDEDFAFVALVAEEVAYYARKFNSVEAGGMNGWRHFGYVEGVDSMASEGWVDPFYPARGAHGAFVEAALITADYENYTEANVQSSTEAGMYGALSNALELMGPHFDP